MVLIKGQAQFNYVKYYPIKCRWVLIDQQQKKNRKERKIYLLAILNNILNTEWEEKKGK